MTPPPSFSAYSGRPRRTDEMFIRRYVEMYDRFFAERPLIPAGRYHEVAFEDLERDPVGQLREIYAKLDSTRFRRGRDAGAAVRRIVVGLPKE